MQTDGRRRVARLCRSRECAHGACR
ncbi:MAG: hypothetical protein JWO42_447, partial [Chloroflexi bacterium]|nr:hypothetical protein [Chloroflexota bacterium]